MSLTIFLDLVKENFPPRLLPDAYSEVRTAANRSGIDTLRYKKRKSDPFWCEQLKRTDSKKVKKNQSSAPSQMEPADGANTEQQSQQNYQEDANP